MLPGAGGPRRSSGSYPSEPNRLEVTSTSSLVTTPTGQPHHLLIAHFTLALAPHDQRAYRPAASLEAHVISALADWANRANHADSQHWKAAKRFLQFQIAWFAEPLFKAEGLPAGHEKVRRLQGQARARRSTLPQFTGKDLVRALRTHTLNHFTPGS